MTFERISNNEMHVFVDVKNDAGDVEELKFEYKRQ